MTSSLAQGIYSPYSSDGKAQNAAEAQELAFGQVWKDAGTRQYDSSHPSQRPTVADRRKSSVQFNTGSAEETIRKESLASPMRSNGPHASVNHRKPSPPPPVPYSRGVTFDTFQTPDATAEAFSMQYKHHDFAYSPRTRTFICGTDAKDYSEYALEWTLDELVDDGDEIVCLRVVAEDSVERRHYKKEAERLLDSVIAKNAIERKAISLKMELAVGKVTDVIQSMIHLYEPVAIIVGTRGRALTSVQGLMGGSVSKYCLQRSPVPTIVVRPSSKRTKKKMKRQAEAGRSVYTSILSKAHTASSQYIGDKSVDVDGRDFETQSKDKEAEAVEKAVGPRKGILRNRDYGGGLARVTSTSLDDSDDEVAPSFALPIGFLSTESAPKADVAMKNPIIQALVERDDDTPRNGSRTGSPASKDRKKSSASDTENAVADSDEENDAFGKPKIVEERRPSTRSQTPWLDSILRRPEPKERRSVSRDRGSRSRSR